MKQITIFGLILLLLSLPLPVVARSATPAAASGVPGSGDFAGLVDIGGRSLATARAVPP